METTNKQYEFNVMFILQSLLHYWYIILISMIVIGACVFSYAKFLVTPIYSSTVKMYVNNESTSIGDYVSSGEITAARELVNTYIAILETPDTLEKVIEKADIDYTVKHLSDMITAGDVNDTQVFYVTVHSPDPVEAAMIADTICEVLPERISEIIDKSSVRIIQYADVPTSKSSPNIVAYTIIGIMLGFAAGVAIVIIKEFTNNSISDEKYPEKIYNVRTLAYIPDLYERVKDKKTVREQEKKNGKLTGVYSDERSILCENLPFAVAEAYKMLRTNLYNIAGDENAYKVIGVTSPSPKVGKSTLAINYSYMLAQTGKRVVLIEADMRKPVLAKRLNLTARLGLSDMILDPNTDAIQDSGRVDNWKIISAGTSTHNPSELLGSRSMELLIERLRNEYDYVVVDLPPINEVSDTMTLSRCLDGILCVVKQGETTKIELDMAMHYMTYSKSEFVGYVITNARIGGKYGRYGRYGKRYYTYEA